MSDKSDAKILQVLSRQPRQDRVVDLILAEGRLILFEAKLPQPTSDVHGGTLVRLPLHDPLGETACLGRGSNDRFGSFATESAGFACQLMSASLQKRPNCCAAARGHRTAVG